jgi:hypothetical protein
MPTPQRCDSPATRGPEADRWPERTTSTAAAAMVRVPPGFYAALTRSCTPAQVKETSPGESPSPQLRNHAHAHCPDTGIPSSPAKGPAARRPSASADPQGPCSPGPTWSGPPSASHPAPVKRLGTGRRRRPVKARRQRPHRGPPVSSGRTRARARAPKNTAPDHVTPPASELSPPQAITYRRVGVAGYGLGDSGARAHIDHYLRAPTGTSSMRHCHTACEHLPVLTRVWVRA